MDRETLEGLSKKDLAEMAREKGVAGFRSLTKEKLVEALLALLTPKGRGKKATRAKEPHPAGEKSRVVSKATSGPGDKIEEQKVEARPEPHAPAGKAQIEVETRKEAEERAGKAPMTLAMSASRAEAEANVEAASTSKTGRPPKAEKTNPSGSSSKAGNSKKVSKAEKASAPEVGSGGEKAPRDERAPNGAFARKVAKAAPQDTGSLSVAGGKTPDEAAPSPDAPAGKSMKSAKARNLARSATAVRSARNADTAPPEMPEPEPEFKPAEAFLDEDGITGSTEVEYERGPDGKPVLGPDGKPKVKARPRFKKTSKVEELLEVDESLGELPPTYDEDRAVLLVRDPQWAYAYWDMRQALARRDPARGDYRQILRVQEMSGHEDRPAYFYDVPVPPHARSWYLKLPGDGRRYRVEVGLHYRDGSYAAVAVSNAIEMPRARPSEVVADKFVTLPLEPETAPDRPSTTSLPPVAEWMVAPESAGTVASVAPPLAPVAGKPSPTPTFEPSVPAAGWEEAQIRPWAHPWSGRHPFTPEQGPLPGAPGLSGPISSHALSSWGFAPGASEELQRGPRAKDFWLVADAELIVYGATEPDAKVSLRGERIQLRPDGTFSFRFYLPDGLHPIPIRALNADEDDERMITITVSRKTEGDGKTNLRKS